MTTSLTTHFIEKEQIKEIESGKYRNCYLIYNRKSTDEPENQKNSLKYQKSENARFAYREQLHIAPLTANGFCQDGIISEKHSGFKEDSEIVFGNNGTIQYRVDRPKFYQLVQFLNKGCFKGVVILCWDRASRNKGDNTIINKLIMQGVDFRFTLASYDKTSAGALHMDIDGMFAEHNSRVTREKVKLNIRKQRDLGFCVTKAPVGYLNLGQMENKPIDEIRAPIIVKMFELYSTAEWSMLALARWATDQGFTMPPTRRKRTLEERMAEEEDDMPIVIEPICRPPTVRNIQAILRSRFYIGELKGNDGIFIKSNCHKALISIKLFNQVQKVAGNRNTGLHYSNKLEYPYRGLLRCGDCNRIYTPYPKKGILYLGCRCSYACGNTHKNINERFLVDEIGEYIQRLSFTEDEKLEIDRRVQNDLPELENKLQAKVEIADRKKKKVKEDLAYLQDNKLTLIKAGVYSAEAFVIEEFKLQEAMEKFDRADESTTEIVKNVKSLMKLSELLKSLYLYYKKATSFEKDNIIKILFSELTLSENSLMIKSRNGFAALQSRFMFCCAPEVWPSELTSLSHSINTAVMEVEELIEVV